MNARFGLLLLVIVLLAASFALSQTAFTGISGSGVSKSEFLDWGNYNCPGGKTAGPWPPTPPCTEGSRVQVRKMVYQFNIKASDDRLTGKFVNVFNANTDGWTKFGLGSGPLWGACRLFVVGPDGPTGEIWDGNWTGKRQVTEGGALSLVRAELHGSGGRIQGLRTKLNITVPHTTLLTFTGRILAPGGK
jgi:hypothetical protein